MCASLFYGGQKPNSDGGSLVANGNGKSPASAPLLAAALNAISASVTIIDAKGVIVAVNDAWRRYADENGLRWPRYGIGYNYLSVLDNASQDDETIAVIAAIIRRVLQGATDSYRAEYACQTPSRCHFLQQVTAFEFGGVRHALVSYENITLQKLNEAELRSAKEAAETALREEELRRNAAENRLRVVEAIADLLGIASSGLPIEDALQGMVERIHRALRSQAAAVFSAEDRWDRLVPVAASGTLPSTSTKGKHALAPAILARALGNQRGIGVNDIWEQQAHPRPATETPTRQPDFRGLLVTPVQRKDTLYGYLVIYYAQPREFTDDDIELGLLFAQQVSLALDHAELRSRAERVAVENERNRLARDLHDAVTQTLFSASVVAEALPRVWDRDPVEGKRALEDLRLWTRGALAEMRTLLMELRPAALIEKPLPDLIRQLGEAAATRLLIPVSCDITGDAEPPDEVKLSLYRIAQESLNNMVKHSSASHVEIRYVAQSRGVHLAITDDGRGFEVERASSGQLGLGIMRERARHVGARLTIRSAPGAGTELEVEWRPRERKYAHE